MHMKCFSKYNKDSRQITMFVRFWCKKWNRFLGYLCNDFLSWTHVMKGRGIVQARMLSDGYIRQDQVYAYRLTCWAFRGNRRWKRIRDNQVCVRPLRTKSLYLDITFASNKCLVTQTCTYVSSTKHRQQACNKERTRYLF